MYFTRIDSGYACMTNTGLLHYKQAGSFMPFLGKEGILPSPLSDFAKKSFLLTFFSWTALFLQEEKWFEIIRN